MAVIKRNNQEWRKLVVECESSGMSQQEWCLANSINYYTYVDRARRLRRMDEEGACGPMFPSKGRNSWVEVKRQIIETQEVTNPVTNNIVKNETQLGEIYIKAGKFTISVTDNFNEAALVRVLNALDSINFVKQEVAL